MKKFKYFIFVLLFFAGCGRKQKNIFFFPDPNAAIKVNKLSLPVVKGISAKKTLEGNKISWLPVKSEQNLIGYNIYRLVRASIVPKKSLNKNLLQQTEFLDKESVNLSEENNYFCYLVRAVFKIKDQEIQGPASQIVCI